MNTRALAIALLLSLGCWDVAGNASEPAAAPAKDKAAPIFAGDKVWTMHLEIPAANWDAMLPTRGMMFGGPRPAAPPKQPPKERPDPVPPRGGFGFDFAYVKADLEFDGQKLKDIGVRFKGNSSYSMAGQTIKRPFKIDFNRYVEDQQLHGLKMLNLANNFGEPSQLREALAYYVFRAAGVPAPRTAFAELHLTIPGKHDRAFAGLYTLIEQVDKTFLKKHFKNAKGLLVKPEGIQGLPYLGTDWKPYEDSYRPKDEAEPKAQRRLLELTRLVSFADDAEFNRSIDRILDVDRFLRYLAACSVIVNLDSFVGLGHNYYLYLNPTDNRFVLIPWDLNFTFGQFGMGGGPDQHITWSIHKPYLGRNPLTERLLAVPAFEAAYRKHLSDLATGSCTPARLHAEIDRMQQTVQKVMTREAQQRRKGPPGGVMVGGFGQGTDLKTFVRRRVEAVIGQLAGTSEGREMSMGFFGGGPGGQRGGLGSQLTKPILTAADADKDGKLSREEAVAALTRLFQECDKESTGVQAEKVLAEGIARLLPAPPPGGFGAPRGPGTSRSLPGIHLAGFLFTRAGVKDNRLALKDLLAVGEKLFRDADQNKDGALDEQELTAALNALPPVPAQFGPPGGRPAVPRMDDKKVEKKP